MNRNELTRFDPFREFENFFPTRWRGFFDPAAAEPAIKLDVVEDEAAYHVKADLPGVKKEDIAVEIDGNQVSLSAEVRREKEEKKDEKVVHAERYFGRQFRSFTLAHSIDRKAVDAKFADGVLELTLPKDNAEPSARITIQ